MGNFTEHIQQSKKNLEFLSKINKGIDDSWDWQVTTCFYVAVHLINAHIVHTTNKNYLSHSLVSDFINPFTILSPSKLDEKTYKSYVKLQQLSRRSRYLLGENFKKEDQEVQKACITFDKHFKKAIHHLDNIMIYISDKYGVSFSKCEINCIELKGLGFTNFTII